jgi:hypothetical protein
MVNMAVGSTMMVQRLQPQMTQMSQIGWVEPQMTQMSQIGWVEPQMTQMSQIMRRG